MSKRAATAQQPGAPADKKSKGENGGAAAAPSALPSVSAPPHSGKSTHSFHGPLPILAADPSNIKYLAGFGSEHQSEALPKALPIGQNTPQVCPYGLFAEQLSGTSFTTPRKDNQKAWLYRVRPSAGHPPFYAAETKGSKAVASNLVIADFSTATASPNQFRWQPFAMDAPGTRNFIQGLATLAGQGSADAKAGLAIHIYTCNASMVDTGFANSDGDFLIVPQTGTLHIRTEMGMLVVPPGHIAVVQRGMVFSVGVEGPSRGYICEVFNGHFKLPELGPIGANGLANPRDFQYPTAAFEDRECKFTVIQKFMGKFFGYERKHSPYDVVAWHGNYAPFMYDLTRFCPVGAVRFDHMDPSIFTVLTVVGPDVGVASCDFVFFPPRYAVQEHTFRPPYFHRNCMSEFMGNIMGIYEAKAEGFLPGGASLHSCMAAHGPDAATFKKASTEELKPQRLPDGALSFMFESGYMLKLTDWALKIASPDSEYWKVWEPLQSGFNPDWKPASPAAAAASSNK